MKRIVRIIGTLGLFVAAAAAHAQSLEDQLRSRLSDVRGQLATLQAQQAQSQARQASLQQQRDQARKQLAAAQAELATLHDRSAGTIAALAAARSGRQRAEDQVKQSQQALSEASVKQHDQDARIASLGDQLAQAQQQNGVCTAKNAQLYAVGKQILDAYVHVGLGTVLAARQPFAAKARVRLDTAAQGYGDKLYEQRYVPAARTPERP